MISIVGYLFESQSWQRQKTLNKIPFEDHIRKGIETPFERMKALKTSRFIVNPRNKMITFPTENGVRNKRENIDSITKRGQVKSLPNLEKQVEKDSDPEEAKLKLLTRKLP